MTSLTTKIRPFATWPSSYALLILETSTSRGRHSSTCATRSQGTGLCYAKAHLLAALLRAEGIPTGLCYQLLTDDETSFMLHGLVAIHLEGSWHRQDPRGNKAGVDAQFRLDTEQLAWPVRAELGERDYPDVFRHASPRVVSALTQATDLPELYLRGLPSEP